MRLFRHPIATFLVGAIAAGATVAGTYEMRQSNRMAEDTIFAELTHGLNGISGIADPAERERQLRQLEQVANLGYEQVFRERLSEELQRSAAEKAALEAAADDAARQALADQQAEEAERRERELEEQEPQDILRREAERVELLRALEAERICRDPSCTSWIFR